MVTHGYTATWYVSVRQLGIAAVVWVQENLGNTPAHLLSTLLETAWHAVYHYRHILLAWGARYLGCILLNPSLQLLGT